MLGWDLYGKQVAMGIVYNKKNPLSSDKGFLKIK